MSMSTIKLLQNAYKKVMSEPVEGFTCEIVDSNNLFDWLVYLEGPKETPYEGGVFRLLMKFPPDYPMSPPELRFLSGFWHPNVYDDGKVCISILHPPGEDPMSGERPGERWLPTQTVTTIVLSVMSMLADPNISSPANVDASVQWRKDRTNYIKKCRELVERANSEKPAYIIIPHPDTDPEERQKQVERMKILNKPMELSDDDEEEEMDVSGEPSEEEDIEQEDEEETEQQEEEEENEENEDNEDEDEEEKK